MPGVVVTTNVRSGPSAGLQPASGQFFVVGQFERGDTTAPTRLRSIAELRRNFGGRTSFSDAYDQLYTFFSEGGDQAYVARVVGAGATIGDFDLVDRNSTTPAPTLKVSAANAGAWSSNLTVQVSDGPVPNSTFRITVRLNGAIVEDHNNLTSPTDAAQKFSTSPYVRLTDLGSLTEAPANIPAVMEVTSLTAGSDDRGTLTSDDYVASLAEFVPEFGDGAVAIPGQTGASIFNGLITHAQTNNRVALLAGARGDSVTNLQTAVASLNSEYAGFFAPWVTVPSDSGITKVISPEGYVAGVRARAHRQIGPWRAPAGAFATANYVLDVDQKFTQADADLLDDSKVSVIRNIRNTVRLYGWRSVSNNTGDWAYLKDRDTINRIVVESSNRLEQFVFDTIDSRGVLLASIQGELVGMLDPMAQAHGLFGTYDEEDNEIDPGYIVNVSDEINPVSSLSSGVINAEIGVRISPIGSLINLVITKTGLLASLAS